MFSILFLLFFKFLSQDTKSKCSVCYRTAFSPPGYMGGVILFQDTGSLSLKKRVLKQCPWGAIATTRSKCLPLLPIFLQKQKH